MPTAAAADVRYGRMIEAQADTAENPIKKAVQMVLQDGATSADHRSAIIAGAEIDAVVGVCAGQRERWSSSIDVVTRPSKRKAWTMAPHFDKTYEIYVIYSNYKGHNVSTGLPSNH